MLIKKSVLTTFVALAALSVSAVSFAAPPAVFGTQGSGFVVGVQGGYADTHFDDAYKADDKNSIKDTGFTARGFLGYDFNKILGIEAGYTYLPTTTFKNVLSSDTEIKNYAIDLLAKLSVPVATCFSLYAKAGISYLNSKADGSDVGSFASQDGSHTRHHIGPAFGVGASYEVVPNLAIDLSWMRFSGQSDLSKDYQPSPDVVLLGVSYKFPTNYS